MDANQHLTRQHRELEALLKQFQNAPDGTEKKKLQLCQKVTDLLAVHPAMLDTYQGKEAVQGWILCAPCKKRPREEGRV